MTLQDVIDFLYDEAQEQTLTRRDIERCVLLVHDMGVTEGRSTVTPPLSDKFGWSNDWLADMGYATWLLVMKREIVPELRGTIPETLEDSQECVQHAWRAAAAAIRRRVVNWRLPAEEGPTP